MTEADAILIEILAETDALFTPLRNYHGPRPGNTTNARNNFAALGIPWASHAVGVAARKAVERGLAEAGHLGSVVIYKPKGRSIGVRLSDDAEARCRALLGSGGLSTAWCAVVELTRHCDREPKTMERLWVAETVMARHPWGDPDTSPFIVVEDMLLPALIRGWAASGSDIQGHVYYRLTRLGWSMVDAGYSPPLESTVPRDRDADAMYYDRFKLALARLGSTVNETREIGPLPLPVSMQGVQLLGLPKDPPPPAAPNNSEA